MENEDETTWYKESGLIAQEVYYDAPELRHLVRRGKAQTDEEGNEIPLPEIPTSINPQEDPDYSSWGEEAASLNYIGLIAYLVKANNELHDRVKALEILTSFQAKNIILLTYFLFNQTSLIIIGESSFKLV